MDRLKTKIHERYSGLNACSSLGCGNNLDYLNLKPGERVLDLGCGNGLETISAALLVGEKGLTIGLDLTPKMIAAATENARRKGVGNVQFMVGDIERLIFEDAGFDVVTSNCVINHARDKAAVYREIFRILKPGGRLVVSDAVSKLPLPEYVKNDPEAWAACFGGAVTEWEYLQSIKKAGFGGIEILKRREYPKNGYDFISLTLRAVKGGETR